jgi:transcriptional regulator GlxA family with amidase domain
VNDARTPAPPHARTPGNLRSLDERRPRAVAVVTFDGAQSLDVTGPIEVFATATVTVREANPSLPAPYRTEVLAAQPGPVRMGSGIHVSADRSYMNVRGGLDTLIVSGGDVSAAAVDLRLRQWLRVMASRVRRLASVCSGSFILAEAGVLDGKCATTHWLGIELMRQRYPRITVEPDAIFVRDGHIYTSAGVTAGIDLALAMVEEDLGHAVALAVARRLVVFLKRPGGQSQFSSHLAAQSKPAGILKGLPEWMLDNLAADLSVERLAARAGMSPRNFARVFTREMGTTPAKFVERARVDAARRCLEDQGLSLDEVASRCGFSSAEHLRRTFRRHVRVVPHDYRKRFHVMERRVS